MVSYRVCEYLDTTMFLDLCFVEFLLKVTNANEK